MTVAPHFLPSSYMTVQQRSQKKLENRALLEDKVWFKGHVQRQSRDLLLCSRKGWKWRDRSKNVPSYTAFPKTRKRLNWSVKCRVLTRCINKQQAAQLSAKLETPHWPEGVGSECRDHFTAICSNCQGQFKIWGILNFWLFWPPAPPHIKAWRQQIFCAVKLNPITPLMHTQSTFGWFEHSPQAVN